MDYYRKKFKPSKPTNNENVDVLSELESKWNDMQPRIHESTGDKTKIPRLLSEIRSYIEYCQRVEEKISEEQQERIKEIIKKCKEVLVKYGNISEINTSGIKSPRLFRKVIPAEASDQAVPQNKVALVEVEEKLKSMRQRRLDRLSVFVAEQSKLSEERSNKSTGSNEIENAIKSIQQIGVEKKSSFKSITEENVSENERADVTIRRHSSESSDKSKSFSTKKFINKFNCSATQIGSSNEDLTKEDDDKKTNFAYSKSTEIEFQSLGERHDFSRHRSSLRKDKEADENKYNTKGDQTRPTRSSLQKGKEEIKQHGAEIDDYNPLLSPMGKQRKAIYLYDNECKFLENEKHDSVVTSTEFEKNYKQEHLLKNVDVKPKRNIGHFYENRDIIAKNDQEKMRVLTTFGKSNQENLGKKPDVVPKSKPVHVYENRAIIDKNESAKPQTSLTTFGKNNNEHELGKKTDNEAKEQMGYTYENKEQVITKDSDKSQSGLASFGGNNPEEVVGKNSVVPIKAPEGSVRENIHVSAKNEFDNLPSLNASESGAADKQRNSYEIKKVVNTYENIKFKPKKSNSLTKLIIKTEVASHRKSNDSIPRSPLPLPRRSNNGERVLKKLQRNWDSLNQIIEHDSDVDTDELEDLKKTWEEANILLGQYKARIEKLERKPNDTENDEKLNDINIQLKDVEKSLDSFRGLKRDSSYKQLSSRLSNYFLVVNKINCSKAEALDQKRRLLSEIETYIKTLENKVNRNEGILLEILEAQVKTIGTKYLNITQV